MKCRYCGKEFIKDFKKKKNGLLHKGLRNCNAVTCSKKCSRIYNNIRQMKWGRIKCGLENETQ